MFRALVNFQYVRRKCSITTVAAQEQTFCLLSRDFMLFQPAQFTGHEITLITLILLHPVLHSTPSLMFSDNVPSQSVVAAGHEATEVTRQPILRSSLLPHLNDKTCESVPFKDDQLLCTCRFKIIYLLVGWDFVGWDLVVISSCKNNISQSLLSP